jgi:SsrA-binding protein
MAAKPQDSARYTELRNPKALRDYFIHDKFEAGVKLAGTEVKSIRAGKAQITDAFARLEKGDLWLHGAYIEEYSHGGLSQHAPRRPRKLLLHAHELRKLTQATETGGKAIVALRMYFKQALVKVEIALATGKKQFDKREDIKRREQNLEARRAVKFRR